VRVFILAVVLAVGCDSESGPDGAVDGASDAGDASTDGVAEPALPTLTPCAPGWRGVTLEGVTVCEPWPEGGFDSCSRGAAHFVGEMGCAPIGSECPLGPFPVGLPTDVRVLYASAGAAPGGDGSETAPYATIAAALAASGTGDVIAVAKGTYEETLLMGPGRTLWGACAAETRIEYSDASDTMGVIQIAGPDVVMRGISIGGARPGITAGGPVSLELEGVEIDGAAGIGMGVGAGAVTGNRVVIRNTRANAAGSFGMGVLVQDGGSVTLANAVVAANVVGGVLCSADSDVRLTDSAIMNNLPQRDGTFGRGVSAQEGAQVVLERVVVEGNAETSLLSLGAGTVIELIDTVVRDTLAGGDGSQGRGISAQEGGRLELTRTFLARNRESAVHGSNADGITLDDVVVLDALPQESDGRYGFGVALVNTPFELARVVVVRARTAGILLELASTGVIRDLTVTDTVGEEAGGLYGRGLTAQGGADFELIRASFIGNRDVSVLLHEATMRAEDIVVRDTRPRQCAMSTCTDAPYGIGLGAYRDSVVDVRRFRIRDSSLAGAQVALDGGLDLHEGTVAGNPIGANVQVEGYDLARLSDDVEFVDNGVNLDALDLPVPDPADAPPEI